MACRRLPALPNLPRTSRGLEVAMEASVGRHRCSKGRDQDPTTQRAGASPLPT